jgi:endonuclease YncB( thermonuclease family)
MFRYLTGSGLVANRAIGRIRAASAAVVICAALPAIGSEVSANTSDCRLKPGPSGTVTEVLDAATVILDDKLKIRLVAILPPRNTEKAGYGIPQGAQDLQSIAAQSKTALAKLVRGQPVDLAYDGLRQDRYGRALAHLYVRRQGERIWVQRRLVEGGLARVSSYRDNRNCIRLLQGFEQSARSARRGLWSLGLYQVMRARRSADILRRIRTFQLVEGTVLKIGEARGRIFLNFADNWKSDFTVSISRQDRKLFLNAQFDLKALEGRRIRVRGWVERWNGPMIKVTHPEQIELLDQGEPAAPPAKSKDPEHGEPGLRRI